MVHPVSETSALQRRLRFAQFLLFSTLTATGLGALLGALGGLLDASTRLSLITLFFIGGIVVSILELHLKLSPPQFNRETPKHWVSESPLRWAFKNGSALGSGVTSRIGFWLWFVVPAGSLLSATPVLGGAIYGAYGFTRGVLPALFLLRMRRGAVDEISLRILRQEPVARRVSGVLLCFEAVVGLVVIGL